MHIRSPAALIPALALVLVMAPPSATAHANGQVVRFDRQVAGPYEIALGTIPATPGVGNLHLTMSVADAVTKTYILGADVVVTASGPGTELSEVGPLSAYDSLQAVGFYDVNTSVDREGSWTFNITISSDLGDASADFDVEVRNASPMAGVVTLFVLIALLTVVGLAVRAIIGERGRQRRRGGT